MDTVTTTTPSSISLNVGRRMQSPRGGLSGPHASLHGRHIFVLFIAFSVAACEGEPRREAGVVSEVDAASAQNTASDTMQANVRVGAGVLADNGFDAIGGRRVGLVVNHTARVDTAHLIDVLHRAPGIEITALFGPEHGIRGDADAGEVVADGRDAATGAPIHSLYGSTRKPTPEMLADVDALLYDIQDVGSRFYTYISTLGLAMQAAAEQDIPFYVLDRPNPLGGNYVSGFVLEEEYESFVGRYPIPVAYGLTAGELAQLIQGEGLMDGLEDLELNVIRMEGWQRDMLWPETGLPFIPPSPNIPDFETALVYAGDVFFEAASASEGRGTRTPFLVLGAPWADGQELADSLNAYGLPGVRFEPSQFTPESIEGMSSEPKLEGEELQGIRYIVNDPEAFRPVETGIHVLHAFYRHAERENVEDFISRPEGLARLAGTESLLEMLRDGASAAEIIRSWEDDVAQFRQRRAPYLLY
jgi:uncharacterized protein YbbC (DUF1343 family)